MTMLRVSLVQAKPGMTLALPVFHPKRHDTVLLNSGFRLDARTIERLRELALREVWVRYPGMDFVAEYISPAVIEAHAQLTWQIGQAFDTVSRSAQTSLDYAAYRRAVSGLLEKLLENPRSAVFIQELADRDRPMLRHGSSVCMISLLMGLKLMDYLICERTRLSANYARDVSNLGVGAMLHDIGMLRLDPGVVAKWKATYDEDDPAWRNHVLVGYEMVREHVAPTAAAAVLHHHQRYDGSGFPARRGHDRGQAGSEIHIFARIIATADLFDRLRYAPLDRDGPDAPPLPTVRALRTLREKPYRDWIDPMVFRALLTVVPAYAPGTQVMLSNGERAVVAEWFCDDPCRPTVVTIGDPTKDFDAPPGEAKRYQLRNEPDLVIVESEGQDVRDDNFFPQTPGEFDLNLAGKGLFNRALGDEFTRPGPEEPARPLAPAGSR